MRGSPREHCLVKLRWSDGDGLLCWSSLMIEIKVESPGQAPRVQRFSSTVITVGRATDCELCVDDPSISRRHCRISRAADGWFVEDLGSANGTGVAGERVVGSCVVMPGVAITLGDLRLEIVARARPLVSRSRAPAVVGPGPGARDISEKKTAAVDPGRARPWLRRGGVMALAMVLAGLGGWASAKAWDRPLVFREPVTSRCRTDDPGVLAADAAADAAAQETDAEAAVRAGLQAFLRVEASACAGQSRAGSALRGALARLDSQRLGEHGSALRSVAVADDTRVATLDEDGGVMLWDRQGPGRPLAGVRSGQAIARSPDGRWLAVGEVDGQLRVWDLGDEAAAPTVQVHGSQAVNVLAFARDGRLVSGDAEGRLRVWQAVVDGSAWHATTELRAWAGVTRLELAGGSLLAFGAGRAAVWQVGRPTVKPLALTTGAVLTAAALDDRGTQVVVGDAGGVVTRWQIGRRARAEALTAHAAAVQAVVWVGDAVASVGADDALRVAELGRRVRRAGPPLVLVADIPVPVDSLVVTGGGRWLVGAGTEGAVVTWDLQQRSRRLPATLRAGHRGPIEAMVAGDGWVVTAGADGVARAWDMTRETAIDPGASLTQEACRALGWSEPGCS